MTEFDHRQDDIDESDIAQLLEAAGAREELPGELRERWESHFRSELQRASSGRRPGFLVPLLSLAASVLVLLLVLDFFAGESTPSTPMQVLAVDGDVQLALDERRRLAAIAGQNLSAGVTLETRPGGRVALTWAGYDVRMNDNSTLRLMNDRLQLEAGEIYVSDVGRRVSRRPIAVVTPFAVISDVGTQFKVRFVDDNVISSVRRGSILVRTKAGEHRVDAAPERGRTLTITADSSVTVSPDGTDWEWIYAVSRRFDLEGRSVYDFLQWSVSETGRELRFADESVALAARNTRFSGAVKLGGLDPDRAVAVALSTTHFSVEADADGSLRVTRRLE